MTEVRRGVRGGLRGVVADEDVVEVHEVPEALVEAHDVEAELGLEDLGQRPRFERRGNRPNFPVIDANSASGS